MTRGLRALRARLVSGTAGAERGSAVVEFLGVALVLLLPLMYLVLTAGRLQAATFAVEGASREAARAFVTAPTADDGARLANAAVSLALEDQGFRAGAGGLAIACTGDPCLEPGGEVVVRVHLDVPLPLVPSFVRSVVPLAVPVEAQHVASVDEYAARRP